ncbi:DUF5131 family protein [Saccharothrix deserti]|uniref:DUF5131 family protein n=1 Tax=Saccharothrix deserti TaxID=2593674 RepID=UPI002367964C|nr:DUF5131 family protein [Saccharothrix deserti]
MPWPDNVWIGTSVEDEGALPRIADLAQVPAAVRFLSCEPLIGPLPDMDLDRIDWVIVGGESGSNARPVAEAWITDILDQCQRAEVPFFFKQWGGRTPKAGGRLLDGRTWDQMPEIRNRKETTPTG